jgi:lipoprotein NlpI
MFSRRATACYDITHRATFVLVSGGDPMISLVSRSFLVLAVSIFAATDEDFSALFDRARMALRDREPERALELAGKAIEVAPKDSRGHQLRADIEALLGQHREAIADYDMAIKFAPDQAELYDRRGSERFKLGQIEGSIADFDRFIVLRPDQEPAHWKRGISYYYAGRFDDGRKQFEGYQTVDDNDVENAVWRFLCMARADGVAKARAAMLPIKRDTRVPMMQIYSLYRGDIKPEAVLAAAQADDPPAARLKEQLFYAHLYLALYYEVTGDAKLCAEHLAEAEKLRIPHYMGDVAVVHGKRLRAAKAVD